MFLSTLDRTTGLYQPIEGLLTRINPRPAVIVDLASGSGETTRRTVSALESNGTVLNLTDKYPLRLKSNPWSIEKLDVLKDPFPKADLYTIFNAFHHFNHGERLLITVKAKNTGGKFLAVEPLQPSLIVFIKVFFSTLLGPLVLAPFMRPFSFWWILYTYLLPVGLLSVWWDGMASITKSIRYDSFDLIKKEMEDRGNQVELGELKGRLAKLRYLLVE